MSKKGFINIQLFADPDDDVNKSDDDAAGKTDDVDPRDAEIETLKAQLADEKKKLAESNNIVQTLAAHKKKSREIEEILKEYV